MFKHWKLPVVLALVSGLMLGTIGMTRAQTTATSFQDVPVTGTTDTGAVFEGTLDITSFRVADDTVTAVGRLTGEIAGVGDVSQRVAIPLTDIAQVDGTCEILRLELGPIDLNLLGLVVHVDPILITIDAQQGPGNLLGNLLCAIAGLFDANAPSNIIADLLNSLLDVLEWLGL